MHTPTRQAITFAVVAVLAFGAGILVDAHGSAANVLARVPIIGSGLDSTPDQSVDLSAFWQAWNTLNDEYVITHASSTMPTVTEKIQGAIQGLAASYGDPYTVYFPPTEAKEFNDQISGNQTFGGIGMEIDVKNGVLTVVAPLRDSPAAAAGIKTGDLILSIDGKSTEGMSTDEAVAEIRGPKGTTVAFVLSRAGKELDISVVRDTITVPEEDDSMVAGTNVYKIALYEFTANSADLFSAAFKRFKQSGSSSLVIDLRGNPGGYLDAAVDIASHFLPKGSTVVTEDYGGKQASDVDTSLGYDDVPNGAKVVVLVDGGSASASEILAGALQDSKAATIMGTQSFGKGSVQQLIPIDGGSLKVTVARWLTPAGHWIMGNGITPDISVPVATSTPAGTDPQLDRAVKFLTTGK